MPVSFTPDNIPRFDSTFLNYVNQNFQRLKQALSTVAKETISVTAPASPYLGQTYYNATSQTTFRWNGSSWKEESFMGNRAFRVDSPGIAAMATGVLVQVPYNTAGLDTALMTYAANVFTVVKAGYYVITASVVYGISGVGANRSALLQHNGTYVQRTAAPANGVYNPGAAVAYGNYFSVGDTLVVSGYHDVGAPLALAGGAGATYFSVVRTGG